jgi:hypothetical protein
MHHLSIPCCLTQVTRFYDPFSDFFEYQIINIMQSKKRKKEIKQNKSRIKNENP